MTIQEIVQLIGNIGLPGVILAYLIWRLDKFLTFLCAKFDKYNDELSNIVISINALTEQLKK